MTTTNKSKKEKSVDLPPKGPRNTDPLSGAAGAHPIETGVGAALGGAAAGMGIGLAAGPVGVVVGAAVGGVLGGLAGKGVGELIDPTIEDTWLREYYETHPERRPGETHETYRPAYRYGMSAYDRYMDRRFDEVEPDLRTGWTEARGDCPLPWENACGAAKHAFERRGRHMTERQK